MAIELKNICFSYEKKPVLKDVNLTIADGEKIALIGESGTGKTTLINLMAGLLHPSSGTITGIPEDGVSMVFQENRLLNHLTVEDNIALVAKHLAHDKILSLLYEVGLKDEATNYPLQLSGGMMRRVAIVRSIAYEKDVYIMDEPFKGLDPKTKGEVVAFVQKHTQGKTLILITHDREEARLLGARLIDLKEINQIESKR